MAEQKGSEALELAVLNSSCVEQSEAIDEPIAGTATAVVSVWLLIQYQQRWERKIANTPLPDKLHDWLQRVQAHYPQLRVQLIRRDRSAHPDPATNGNIIYVAQPGAQVPVRRFNVSNLSQLCEVEPASLLGATFRTTAGASIASQPGPDLYLVCTHGRRDRCCSRLGIALLQALESAATAEEVWHCSHLGGHRFAPTALYLPQGILYGRLAPDDAKPMLAAHRQGHVYKLSSYRGNCRLAPAAQAVESWLRQRSGHRSFAALKLHHHDKNAQPERVEFRCSDEALHKLLVRREALAPKRRSSCNAAEPTLAYRYIITKEAPVSQASTQRLGEPPT